MQICEGGSTFARAGNFGDGGATSDRPQDHGRSSCGRRMRARALRGSLLLRGFLLRALKPRRGADRRGWARARLASAAADRRSPLRCGIGGPQSRAISLSLAQSNKSWRKLAIRIAAAPATIGADLISCACSLWAFAIHRAMMQVRRPRDFVSATTQFVD